MFQDVMGAKKNYKRPSLAHCVRNKFYFKIVSVWGVLSAELY